MPAGTERREEGRMRMLPTTLKASISRFVAGVVTPGA
jgi:hypothetical protein